MDFIKTKNLIIFGPFAILAAVAIVYVNKMYHQNAQDAKLLEDRILVLNEQKDSMQIRAQIFEDLIATDNYFLTGDYETAQQEYEALLKRKGLPSNFEQFVDLRQQKIAAIVSSEDALIDDIQTFRLMLSNSRQQNDSLVSKIEYLNKQIGSSKEQHENELAALKKTIEEQKSKLSSKDKVQVISFINEKGNLIHYLGEVRDGKANGGGVGIFDTGGIYRGEWKNNQRHGKGTYEWKDGHKYEGEFVNGEREGQGTYIWSSGEKYVGQWSAGKRNGQGTLYDKDNNISYEGLWADDKIRK